MRNIAPVLFDTVNSVGFAVHLAGDPERGLQKLPHPVPHLEQFIPSCGNIFSMGRWVQSFWLIIGCFGVQLNRIQSFVPRKIGLIWVQIGPFCGRLQGFVRLLSEPIVPFPGPYDKESQG